MGNDFPVVTIQGLPFASMTMSEVVTYVSSQIVENRGGWIVTPNLDILRRWSQSGEFRALVRPATIFTPDGMPILWLSKILGTPLSERVAGSDLFIEICRICAANGWSVYFLGGNPGAAENAKRVMENRFTGLKVVGTYCPPFGFEHDSSQIEMIAETLHSAQPRVVFVGLGCPKQELVIARLMPGLSSTWWAGIGITFSFVCGEVSRAPDWMQRHGLEWLHRMLQEPNRLFRRYIIEDGPFLIRAIFACAIQRFSKTRISSTEQQL